MRIKSKIKHLFSDELLCLLAAVCDTRRIDSVHQKMELILKLLKKFKIPFAPLGGATNRLVLFIDGYTVKFAVDRQGYKDNWMEYALTEELLPTPVPKSYETNGYILIAKTWKTATKSEFRMRKPDIINILQNLSSDYLMGDVGFTMKNSTNWGLNDEGDIGILDYAYMHRATQRLFQCPVCGVGVLRYTQDFTKMQCSNKVGSCGKIFDYLQQKELLGDETDHELINEVKEASVRLPLGQTELITDDELGVVSGKPIRVIETLSDYNAYQDYIHSGDYTKPEVREILFYKQFETDPEKRKEMDQQAIKAALGDRYIEEEVIMKFSFESLEENEEEYTEDVFEEEVGEYIPPIYSLFHTEGRRKPSNTLAYDSFDENGKYGELYTESARDAGITEEEFYENFQTAEEIRTRRTFPRNGKRKHPGQIFDCYDPDLDIHDRRAVNKLTPFDRQGNMRSNQDMARERDKIIRYQKKMRERERHHNHMEQILQDREERVPLMQVLDENRNVVPASSIYQFLSEEDLQYPEIINAFLKSSGRLSIEELLQTSNNQEVQETTNRDSGDTTLYQAVMDQLHETKRKKDVNGKYAVLLQEYLEYETDLTEEEELHEMAVRRKSKEELTYDEGIRYMKRYIREKDLPLDRVPEDIVETILSYVASSGGKRFNQPLERLVQEIAVQQKQNSPKPKTKAKILFENEDITYGEYRIEILQGMLPVKRACITTANGEVIRKLEQSNGMLAAMGVSEEDTYTLETLFLDNAYNVPKVTKGKSVLSVKVKERVTTKELREMMQNLQSHYNTEEEALTEPEPEYQPTGVPKQPEEKKEPEVLGVTVADTTPKIPIPIVPAEVLEQEPETTIDVSGRIKEIEDDIKLRTELQELTNPNLWLNVGIVINGVPMEGGTKL